MVGERSMIQIHRKRCAADPPGASGCSPTTTWRGNLRSWGAPPPEQILAEPWRATPLRRSGWPRVILQSLVPDAVWACFPPTISWQAGRYRQHVRAAFRAREGANWPPWGYGRAGRDPATDTSSCARRGGRGSSPVLRFREKPDAASARRYVMAGVFY